MDKKEIIPLKDIDHYRVLLDGTLPFEMDKKIGIDLKYLLLLMQIGGLSQLIVLFDRKTGSEQEQLGVASVSASGEAVASKQVVKKQKPYNYEIGYSSQINNKTSNWPIIVSSINIHDVQKKILESQSAITDAEAWAKECNQILSEVIVKAGMDNLLKSSLLDQFFLGVVLAEILKNLIQDVSRVESILVILLHVVTSIIIYASFSLLRLMFEAMDDRFESEGKGRRVSFSWGIELDRALMLLMVSKSGNLVQKLDA